MPPSHFPPSLCPLEGLAQRAPRPRALLCSQQLPGLGRSLNRPVTSLPHVEVEIVLHQWRHHEVVGIKREEEMMPHVRWALAACQAPFKRFPCVDTCDLCPGSPSL